jgi:hypothetical protein
VHRVLPLPTAAVGDREIRILSPLVLLEERELDFYRSRTLALSRLRGGAVERNGSSVGQLRDVIVDEDGRLVAAITGEKRIPFEDGVRFAPRRRTAA